MRESLKSSKCPCLPLTSEVIVVLSRTSQHALVTSLHGRTKFLKSSSIILFAIGMTFFLSLFTPLEALTRLFFDTAFWPLDSGQNVAATEPRLAIAISGALMAGWGAMLWVVADAVFATNPRVGRKIIVVGIATWFVIDCLGSVIVGAPMNVLLNTPFLVAFGIPLIGIAELDEKEARSSRL